MDLRRPTLNQTDNSFKLALPLLSKDSNVVFSPLSIHVSLGMAAAGSDGPTRDQIVRFVTSTSPEELTAFFSRVVSAVIADGGSAYGPVLCTANGLWVDRSLRLKPVCQELLHSVYGAVSDQQVDFQNKAREVSKKVNKWCSKATKGLIEDILPPRGVNPILTRLIITNAVYFKAEWHRGVFSITDTKERDFHLLDGSSVRVPMMMSCRSQYFREFDGFKVLRLPYEQGFDTRVFSMSFYLPDSVDGLPSLRERFCTESGFIDSHLPYYQIRLDKFLVPKFKIDFSFEASEVLKKQGLVLPFEGSGMTEMVESCPFPLTVTGVFHKASIEVNEEGTVAAAASAVLCGGGGSPPSGKEFVADHPFMFVIREDTTGVVLFIGQLLNPLG